jgi:hypothetical protein
MPFSYSHVLPFEIVNQTIEEEIQKGLSEFTRVDAMKFFNQYVRNFYRVLPYIPEASDSNSKLNGNVITITNEANFIKYKTWVSFVRKNGKLYELIEEGVYQETNRLGIHNVYVEYNDKSDNKSYYNNNNLKKTKAPEIEANLADLEAENNKNQKLDLANNQPAEQSGEVEKGTINVVSPAYGVVTTNNNPSAAKTKEYVDLISPQIKAQAYKENTSGTANDMFMYGLRWTRKRQAKKPLNNKSYANKGKSTSDPLAKDGYVYDTVDQNGNALPPLSDLQPIIGELENSLGLDMSNYDSVIGNIYLPGQRIATHRDTTESLSARNYPVVVYTIGNDSGITIYENVDSKGDANGKISFASDKKKVIPTKNGSIYTFGMDGKGRFELAHDTPKGIKRDKKFPPITLPNGDVVTNYTITLTFRRAADLEPGMNSNPVPPTPTGKAKEITPKKKTISVQGSLFDQPKSKSKLNRKQKENVIIRALNRANMVKNGDYIENIEDIIRSQDDATIDKMYEQHKEKC